MFTRDQLLTIQAALHVAANTSPVPAKWRDYIELGDKITQLLSDSEAESPGRSAPELCTRCVPFAWNDGPIDHEPSCTATEIVVTQQFSDSDAQ